MHSQLELGRGKFSWVCSPAAERVRRRLGRAVRRRRWFDWSLLEGSCGDAGVPGGWIEFVYLRLRLLVGLPGEIAKRDCQEGLKDQAVKRILPPGGSRKLPLQEDLFAASLPWWLPTQVLAAFPVVAAAYAGSAENPSQKPSNLGFPLV